MKADLDAFRRSGAAGAPFDLAHLKKIEQRLLWLAAWTVHNANHLREKADDDVKVGGHQASCASIVSIMTALYFQVLRPEDRVAVKPHAAPVFHAMHYLMGSQTREKLENFRGYGGAQSYPSRTAHSSSLKCRCWPRHRIGNERDHIDLLDVPAGGRRGDHR